MGIFHFSNSSRTAEGSAIRSRNVAGIVAPRLKAAAFWWPVFWFSLVPDRSDRQLSPDLNQIANLKLTNWKSPITRNLQFVWLKLKFSTRNDALIFGFLICQLEDQKRENYCNSSLSVVLFSEALPEPWECSVDSLSQILTQTFRMSSELFGDCLVNEAYWMRSHWDLLLNEISYRMNPSTEWYRLFEQSTRVLVYVDPFDLRNGHSTNVIRPVWLWKPSSPTWWLLLAYSPIGSCQGVRFHFSFVRVVHSNSLIRTSESEDQNQFRSPPTVAATAAVLANSRACTVPLKSASKRLFWAEIGFKIKRVFAEFRDLLQLGQSCLQSTCRLKRDCHWSE